MLEYIMLLLETLVVISADLTAVICQAYMFILSLILIFEAVRSYATRGQTATLFLPRLH